MTSMIEIEVTQVDLDLAGPYSWPGELSEFNPIYGAVRNVIRRRYGQEPGRRDVVVVVISPRLIRRAEGIAAGLAGLRVGNRCRRLPPAAAAWLAEYQAHPGWARPISFDLPADLITAERYDEATWMRRHGVEY